MNKKTQLNIPTWANSGYEKHMREVHNKELKRKRNLQKQEQRKDELYDLVTGILVMVFLGLLVLVVGYVEGSL